MPEIKKPEKPKENKIKVSLKEMPKKVKDTNEKEKLIKKPQEMAPLMPKGNQLTKIVEPINRAPVRYEPKKTEQENSVKKSPNNLEKSERVLSEATSKPKIEPLPPTEPYIKLPPKKEKKEENNKSNPLAWMEEDKSEQDVKKEDSKKISGSSIGNSDLRELYGDEFGKLTPGQQKYLIDNQEVMRRITQEVLNRVASVNLTRDINVNRVNIVEFYLHPNGDMTDFKFLKNSGYFVLDDTTKETIEYAYSRYPRPSEKILIRYNVFYNLARH
ncbi:MAG: energy transducer TonB [Campylobacterota bacterium]